MIDYNKIPYSTRETLDAWIRTGRPMGGFCEAVVSNDLREAFGRADENNRAAMYEIVAYLYNTAPIGSWGRPDCLKSWPKQVKELTHA